MELEAEAEEAAEEAQARLEEASTLRSPPLPPLPPRALPDASLTVDRIPPRIPGGASRPRATAMLVCGCSTGAGGDNGTAKRQKRKGTSASSY
jgi:hypothetical protein